MQESEPGLTRLFFYRVTLRGSAPSMIMDLDGNALDGEFGSAFPSGNFVAGGDFVAQATITTPVVMGPTLPQIQAIVFGPSNQKSPQLSGLFRF